MPVDTAPAPPIPRRLRRPEHLRADLTASLVVFLVALPLSLGIAVASGAPVVAGLLAAAVGGIVVGIAGGAPLSVAGPAAGLTAIVAELVSELGFGVTCLVTACAGVVQVLLGVTRIGRATLAVSPAVVHGMLAGIGVTIALGQLHVVLGGQAQSSALANLRELPGQLVGAHPPAVALGLLTIALLVLWPRLPRRVAAVPAPLAAVALVTLVAVITGLQLDRVELPANLFASLQLPELPDGQWGAVGIGVLTIALVASVESLLSAVAIDKLHDGPRADPDRELVGQGLANGLSGMIGGLPVTGVIVRSTTNVKAGGRTRLSPVLHGVWILVAAIALAPVIEAIPLAVLAGLLVVIGVRLVVVDHVPTLRRHRELAVYVVTLLGVVTLNLLEGVALGLLVAIVLAVSRVLWATVTVHPPGSDDTADDRAGAWRVVVEGAVSFLSLPRLSRALQTLPAKQTVFLELLVDYLDQGGYEALEDWASSYRRAGGTVTIDEIGAPLFRQSADGAPQTRRSARHRPRVLASWGDWQAADAPTDTDRLLTGVGEFHRRSAPQMRAGLELLADGQSPRTLFLTCSDSRVVPNVITSSGPGDLFTVRNVGGLVPPHGSADSSVAATLDYAVGVLGVDTVVVCGHSGCGAMGALLDGGGEGELGRWLAHGASTLDRSAPPGSDGFDDCDRLALTSVVQQLDHLRTHPGLAAAEAAGRLRVLGMYFDVREARTLVLDAGSGQFVAGPGGMPAPPAEPVLTSDAASSPRAGDTSG